MLRWGYECDPTAGLLPSLESMVAYTPVNAPYEIIFNVCYDLDYTKMSSQSAHNAFVIDSDRNIHIHIEQNSATKTEFQDKKL